MSEETNEIIKINSEKEIVVDVNSIEDLLSTIKYVTTKMEEVKKNFQPIEHAQIIESLEPIINNIKNMKYSVDDSLASVQEQMKLMKPAIDQDMIKTFVFELEKFKNVDSTIKKIKAKTIAFTVFVSILSTAVVIEYFDFTKSVSSFLIKKQISKQNYVIPKNNFNLQKLSNGQYKLIKRSK